MRSIQIHPYRIDLSSQDLQLILQSQVLVVNFESGYDRELDLKLRLKLLSEISETPQDQLQFGKTDEGKPFLKDSPWNYSVSHSGNYWALALSKNFDVGIDLEQIHSLGRLEKIALRHFLPEENKIWQNLSDEKQRIEALLQVWTRKEAFVKAKASNLFREFRRIHVFAQAQDHAFESFIEPGKFVLSLAQIRRSK